MDNLRDGELRELLFRVPTDGFPADLADVWDAEWVRFRETLRSIPPARSGHEVLLDLGSSRAWLPFYQLVLGYRRIILNTSYPASGFVREGLRVEGAVSADVSVSVFDVERDDFPHEDASIDVVLCLEVLEHLAIDPMAMMTEVNRVLRPGGTFVLTTPNAVRCANMVNMLLGEQPCGWNPYNGFDTNRHNREYTPAEIGRLLAAAGFAAGEVRTFGNKSRGFARDALAAVGRVAALPFGCPSRWRHDVILAAGMKTGGVIDRRPSWLYFDMAERGHPERESVACDGPACDHDNVAAYAKVWPWRQRQSETRHEPRRAKIP